MTPLQLRRNEVCAVIASHLRASDKPNWNYIQAQFPDLPSATFWRYVKRARASSPVESGGSDLGARRARQSTLDEPIRPLPPESVAPLEFLEGLRDSMRKLLWTSDRGAYEAEYGRGSPSAALAIDDPPRQTWEGPRVTFGELMPLYEAQVLSRLPSGERQRRSLAFIIERLRKSSPRVRPSCARCL